MLSIANNVSSLNAQHNLNRSSNAMNRSLERLSSGLKINRGGDGPAALVISEEQRAQIAGLNQAIENTEKAVSLVQTAEGALNEINSLLVKVRSLALDSANAGVNDADALAANQAEIDNALSTIDRIANNTQFGTKKLLDGSAGFNAISTNDNITNLNAAATTLNGQYSVTTTQNGQKGQVSVATNEAPVTHLDNSNNLGQNETVTINSQAIILSAGMTNTQVRDAINAYNGVTGVDASLDNDGKLVLTAQDYGSDFTVVSDVDDIVANTGNTGLGTTTSDTSAGGNHVSLQGQNLQLDVTDPDSNVVSYDVAGNSITSNTGATAGLAFSVAPSAGNSAITSALTAASIVVSDDSLTFQIGGNYGQTATLEISKVSSDALGQSQVNNQFASLAEIDVTTTSGSQDALAVIDQAIDDVTNLRGSLGAFQQNTLESTANNMRTTLENTVAAESVIRDTDFAAETAEFTKQQALVQVGASLLATANQSANLVLSLLQ